MHDLPHDHDHDAHELDVEEEHPLWKLDTITLTSVGIDVGTATSQIIFSQLVLRRLGRELSSRFVVTERDTLYLSPVHLTPYSPGRERVDDQALGRLVDAAYQEAGLTPRDIDTGAIILTGEAIRRDNARAIADLFAAQRGNFVCATAGHNFEALLAAHGSGAVAYSAEKQCRVLNVDIGGGTTKLAVAECGRVLSTAAFHVGGRLLATDGAGTITLLEPGGQALARQVGFEWQVGSRVTNAEIERLANYMAQAILSLAQDEEPTSELAQLWLTAPLSGAKKYDAVIFSGGVGEYVYGKETKSFGDLGAPLGQALQRQISNGALRCAARARARVHPRHGHGRGATHRAGERQYHLPHRRKFAAAKKSAGAAAGRRFDRRDRQRDDRCRPSRNIFASSTWSKDKLKSLWCSAGTVRRRRFVSPLFAAA